MADDLLPGPAPAPRGVRTVYLPVLSRDLADLGVPGVWVEVDPDLAEAMGAVAETAVSPADAAEAGDGD